jgi:hypothetical protein
MSRIYGLSNAEVKNNHSLILVRFAVRMNFVKLLFMLDISTSCCNFFLLTTNQLYVWKKTN